MACTHIVNTKAALWILTSSKVSTGMRRGTPAPNGWPKSAIFNYVCIYKFIVGSTYLYNLYNSVTDMICVGQQMKM